MKRGPRRKLRKRRWIGVIVIAALAALIYADRSGWLLVAAHDDYEYYHGRSVRIARVIDGDTIEVAAPDPLHRSQWTRVRLWGIDAPETGGASAPAEPGAEAAAGFVRDLVEGAFVRLHLERSRRRGEYGRVLAHVELPDGEMLNRRLLLEGLARVDDRWAHTRLSHYAQAERIARRENRGLWSDAEPDEDQDQTQSQ